MIRIFGKNDQIIIAGVDTSGNVSDPDGVLLDIDMDIFDSIDLDFFDGKVVQIQSIATVKHDLHISRRTKESLPE